MADSYAVLVVVIWVTFVAPLLVALKIWFAAPVIAAALSAAR